MRQLMFRILDVRNVKIIIRKLKTEVGHQTLEAGALKSLEAGVDSGDDEAALQCLKAIFLASTVTYSHDIRY